MSRWTCIDWCFVKFYNRIWNIFSNLCFQFFSTNLNLADFSCLELQKNNWKNDLYTQRSSTYNSQSSEKRSLQQQELLTFPEYVSLSVVFRGVRVAQCLVFRVTFCRPLFFLLSFFFILPVLLQFTVFDYPFVIFKLLWHCRFMAVCVPFVIFKLLWQIYGCMCTISGILLSIKRIIIKDITEIWWLRCMD